MENYPYILRRPASPLTPPEAFQYPAQFHGSAPLPPPRDCSYFQRRPSSYHPSIRSHYDPVPFEHYHYHAQHSPQWGSPMYFTVNNGANNRPDTDNSSGAKKQGNKGEGKTDGKKGDGESNGGGEDSNKDSKAKKDDPKKTPNQPLGCLCPVPNAAESLSFDIRDLPQHATLSSPYFSHPTSLSPQLLAAPITSHKPSSVKLISKSIPWCIDVQNSPGVSLDYLLRAIHDFFHEPVTESEFWATTDSQRGKMGSAFHLNCDIASSLPYNYGGTRRLPPVSRARKLEEGLKRVDWLLDRSVFVGLTKDDTFITARVGDKKLHADTWVMVFAPNPSYQYASS